MATLRKSALNACEEALKEYGFHKEGGEIVIGGVGDSFGWVGLNTLKTRAAIEVNPVIGVGFRQLDSVLHQLRDDLPKGLVPAVTRPLGYLMPGAVTQTWEFREGALDRPAGQLALHVFEYGLPFIEGLSNWEDFVAGIEENKLLLPFEREKVVPTVLALAGDTHRAAELVRVELARIDADDLYAISYGQFASKFFEWFPDEGALASG